MNIHAPQNTGPALWVTQASPGLDDLAIKTIEADQPRPGPGQVLVEIKAAGVNPSDVKAALGHMPHAVWPRIPGRDFAGIVVQGPDHLIGTEVWGGGGELGITQNGSHAQYMALPQAAVRAKPEGMSFAEAGSIGVPFITAFEGLSEAGGIQPWESILICGANGKVGQATAQLASMAGATVFGLNRDAVPYAGHSSGPVTILAGDADAVAEQVRDATAGRGVDIVMNTVGSPYFEVGNKALAKGGRHIFISTLDRSVPFDIFTFFRGRHRFIGIDSLARDSVYGAKVFETLKPAFEQGRLKPFPINPATVYGFADAAKAYAEVLRSSRDRVILTP